MTLRNTAARWYSCGLRASRSLCAVSLPVRSSAVTEADASMEFSKSLYRRLSALGAKPGGSVAETMKEWQSEGRKVTLSELMTFVRQFRRYKSYKTALELMDWMIASDINMSSSAHAVFIELLAKCRGIDKAEGYFANLMEVHRNQKTYGALLSGYCQLKMTDKAFALYDIMQKLNIGCTTLTYNNLMTLHMKLEHPEMILLLFHEMKAANVSPDSFTYCLVINSYAAMKHTDSVESFVRDIEKDAPSRLSWSICANMASRFIEAGLFEKAEAALIHLEELMDSRNRLCYHFLISIYAGMGNLAEVIRVWKLLKDLIRKTTNKSFLVVLQAFIKLNEMDLLNLCYDEWKQIHLSFDIRLPYKVMAAYLEKDMIENAEYVLDDVTERLGHGNAGFSWETFIGYHLRKKEVDLALKILKFAISSSKPHQWTPTKGLAKEFFIYFEEARDKKSREEFIKILETGNGVDMDMYMSLLRT